MLVHSLQGGDVETLWHLPMPCASAAQHGKTHITRHIVTFALLCASSRVLHTFPLLSRVM